MTGTTLDVLKEVHAERVRQDAMWGQQDLPDGTDPGWTLMRTMSTRNCENAAENGGLTYRHVLTEEFFEVLSEIDQRKLRTELVQLSAVAVKWIEKIDRDLQCNEDVLK